MTHKERIFIALRPDAHSCKQLIKVQKQTPVSGRMVPPESLHLTLAFLGDCDVARKQCVLDKIADIKAAAFNLQLDEFGYFERYRIFYITSKIVPVELLSLHKQLNRLLSPCRFKASRSFKPHVSLFRGVRSPPFCTPLDSVVQWQVRSVCVERSELSNSGAHYTTLKEQPL